MERLRFSLQRFFTYITYAMSIVLLLSWGGGSVMARSTPPESWVQHSNPLGFVVHHPLGWEVKTTDEGLIMIHSEDKSAFVVIHPFFLRQPTKPRQWMRQVPTLFASLFPQARIGKFHQPSKQLDEVIASMSYNANGKPGQANILCSIYERSGMFFAIAAPNEQFAQKKKSLVRILETFSFTQPSASARKATGDPAIEYVRWNEPFENAFSQEVPRGWKVSGGIFRFATVDIRPSVQVISPDGQIRITGGDAEIPPFVVPNPILQMSGLVEGSWYSPGYGVRMMVKRYLTGMKFAQEYVMSKVARGYAELTFTETRDRPDAARAINAIYAQFSGMGGSQNLSTGEVAFTCRKDDKKMRGYYFGGTLLTAGYGGGVWTVQFLHGYLAVADKVELAQSVLNRMIQSVQLNPQWVVMQQGLTAQTSQIVSRTNAEISSIINNSYWNRQRTQNDIYRKWSNMMLGQTDVVDPITGKTWKVASGHNYYWRKPYTDTIVGTDTYERPDIDFTPLREW